MLNDPLLPGRPESATPRPARRTRRPSPAMSAKILATGLATTAMLGLTTGYAMAKRVEQPTTTLIPEPGAADTSNAATTANPTTGMPGSAQSPSAAPSRDSSGATSQTQPGAVTAPPVVEIPVPQAAPAQPGNNWDNGAAQPSSGSR